MGNATIGWSVHDFLFDFNRNYVSILYRFRDIAGFCQKSPILAHPTCIPRNRSNFAEIFGNQKTRVRGLSCGVVCVILCLAVVVELRLVTDRQTDTGPRLVPRMHSIARQKPRENLSNGSRD